MSYCRFGADSDVYFYADVSGGFTCCRCSLFTEGGDFLRKPISPCERCRGEGCKHCMMHGSQNFETIGEAIEHLKEHVTAGHLVPGYVFEDLEADAKLEREEP